MDKITAELPHPEIQGPPLFRGTRYGHHFVVELISDGRRLWAVASEEGRKILHDIAHGIDPDAPNPPDPSIPVAVGDQSGTGTVLVTDQSSGNLPTGDPNLPPLPEGQAPTTTTGPANTFDS